ncbi:MULTISPECIES: phytoene desaturase family protein [Maribacter]|uniref:NAD(P)/FAD-dependent oxidoreductase n=1 Tax=Maribacter flavus TaxID=1658664 RepID=A0ABU7III6_9FLAO|nr:MULTISPECIES: NAD(P)/FAD-dependent oxidoreductase [Maribacter]MDC6405450.1 NAD(P)/FAD-dependent oxidoreductase [Maribacter sp. PR66]MEE1972782.1 NAD(P)/FAD-dependent oxidoreductase [Maribacter flavus]
MKKKDLQEDISTQNWDSIIIGSGAGGLTTALCLARAGQKVLLLEQHDVPGGWCHSFYLEGHRFTPGVHYIGLVGEGESTSNLYKGLGIANDLVFFRMNPDAYEHVHIGNHRFDFPDNPEELENRLIDRFPKEKKGIKKYLKLIRLASEELYSLPYIKGFWKKLTIPYRTRHFGKYGLFSLKRVINWHIKDPLLKNVLNIQCGDHGVQPKKAAFILHAALMYHYFKGGYYPMGGGGALVKSMTNKFKEYGGVLKTSTSVKKILIEGETNKKATGVELADGRQIFGKHIVSNADVGITYNQLIGKQHLSPKLQKKLEKTIYSCTSLMLFLSVDMDVRKAGLDSGNIWVLPDRDMDDYYDGIMKSDLQKVEFFEALFVSCTTLKDPTSFDGKHHCLEVITFIDYRTFEPFAEESAERSEKYLRFKEELTQKMILGLEKVVPSISKHIVHQELGTPITNQYYINTTRGNVYGTEKSLKHIGPFAYKSKSEIENLYLCGASILSHGVAGASHSGVNTAAVILGCHADELKEPQEGQELLILEAEDTSNNYPEEIQKKIRLRQKRTQEKSKSLA